MSSDDARHINDLAEKASKGEDFNPSEPADIGGESGGFPDDDGGSGGDGDTITNRLMDGLLSTKPDQSPEDYPDLPEHTAHFIIGTKKFLNGALDAGISKGTTAAENYARGAIGALSERQTGGESGDGGDQWSDI